MYQSFKHDQYNTYYYTTMNNSLNQSHSPEFRTRSQTWTCNEASYRSRVEDSSPSQQYTCCFDSLNSHEDSGNSLNNLCVNEKSETISDALPKSAITKKTSRKNPWGQETYADLIENAINSYPTKMATLQQIYDYISKNYKYFLERSDVMSSAGWKNSIRHNLSLHDKFLKCPKKNENMKSSLWSINQNSMKRIRSNSMDCKKNNLDLVVKRRYLKEHRRSSASNSNSINELKKPLSKMEACVKSECAHKEDAVIAKNPEFLEMETDHKYMPPDLSTNRMTSSRDNYLHDDLAKFGMMSMEPIYNDGFNYDSPPIPDFHIAAMEYSKFVADLFTDDID